MSAMKLPRDKSTWIFVGLYVIFLLAAVILFVSSSNLGLPPQYENGAKVASACLGAIAFLFTVRGTRVAVPVWIAVLLLSAVLVFWGVNYLPRPQAPNPPGEVTAILARDGIEVEWPPSTDDNKILEYRVYRDGQLVVRITGYFHLDQRAGLTEEHAYHITAVGRNGLESPPSREAVYKPSALGPPRQLRVAIVSDSTVTLVWEPGDGERPYHYVVARNGVELPYRPRDPFFIDQGLQPERSYSYTIKSSDERGGLLSASTELPVQTAAKGRVISQSDKPPPPPGPTNTAEFGNIAANQAVGKCVLLAGSADLAVGKKILTAHRKTGGGGDFYYHHASVSNPGGGSTMTAWTGKQYLGDQVGQRYTLFLIVMNTIDAQKFYDDHRSVDGSFAHFSELPANGSIVSEINVTQTSTQGCP